ncbi:MULTISPECIES: hypothetical protein [Georgenia]|uniref:hypothetical protein n=1 Tax=Georgenia TaxID=154116 RepID=UPI00143D4943|nr:MULTISPECIES: hypothetical protein [Georgenia]
MATYDLMFSAFLLMPVIGGVVTGGAVLVARLVRNVRADRVGAGGGAIRARGTIGV